MELKDKFFTEHLNSLAPEQWVDLLTADHSFWEYCVCREKFNSRDWRKLDAEDWFLLLINKNIYQPPFTAPELLKFFPADELDGYQWYKLILTRPELEPVCRWGKLDRLAWHVILLTFPQLAVHCTCGALSEADWAELIAKKPELAEYKPQNA